MGFKKKIELRTDQTMQLGGNNSKTGKANPTQVEGYYLGAKDIESDFGVGKLHYFQTAEGTVGVWGKTHMNILLTTDHLGQMVRVSFVGMRAPFKKGRRPSYQYELEYDAENTIDVSGIALQTESGSVDEAASPEEEPTSTSNESDDDLFDETDEDAVGATRAAATSTRTVQSMASANVAQGSTKSRVQELLNRSKTR